MRQEDFIARHAGEWAAFEHWLARRGGRWPLRLARRHGEQAGWSDADLPARYRRLCQQAALARRRGYSPQLDARLQVLVQRGHDVLYRNAPAAPWRRAGRFVLAEFPQLVRAQRGCLWLAAALFSGSMAGMFWLVLARPEFAHSVFNAQQLAGFESMYANLADADARASQDNVQMFGFYVANNIGIGLRTFAGGLLAGVGTLALLAFNGVFFGALAAHVTVAGYGVNLWPFVAGHSALELCAIVISGAAGLRLGLALVAPEPLRRIDALRAAGAVGAKLCAGIVVMLLMAAFIEAFWSARAGVAPWLKFSVGAALWLLVLAWLGCGGRGLDGTDDDAR